MQVIGTQKLNTKGQLQRFFLYPMSIPDMLHLFPSAQQDDIQLSSNQLTDQLHVADSSDSTSSSVSQEIPAFYRTGSFITTFSRARRMSQY